MSRKRKAAVAMSGGVDSSVAAAILLEQGYEVAGLTLNTGAQSGEESPEIRDAGRVARHLGIKHFVLDVAEDFKRLVIGPFLKAYTKGLTPVPCAVCNREMKFGLLLKLAREMEAEFLASGHYARLDDDGISGIRRPVDLERDQTYFLYDIPREFLRWIRFPLGGLMKTETRARARKLGLPVAEKPPSREVCFVENGKTRKFIERRLATRSGPIVDASGRELGRHRGVHFFTVGQRRGLGLGNARAAVSAAKPLHVIALDGLGNRVIVGPEEQLFSSSCAVDRTNFFSQPRPEEEVLVKIRSGHPGAPALLSPLGGDGVRVDFLSPQRAVTPGQAAVFYRGEEVLGGGAISRAELPVPAGAGR